ncbi:MAG: putative Ig domain-containing protein [bacterium]|nr:putative Ig domain-containing protein [bacterium]
MKKSLIMVRILFVLIGLSSLINQQVWADPHNGQSRNVVFIGGNYFKKGGNLSTGGGIISPSLESSEASVTSAISADRPSSKSDRGEGGERGSLSSVEVAAGLDEVIAGLSDFTFSTMAPSDVSASSLAPFDTVVLNVGSSAMGCTCETLTPQQKSDLIAFVASGKKLIIYDSECEPVDYSWLPFPFKTSNPGPQGARGTLTIAEENTLSSSDPANPHYIDVVDLGSNTDAVGDMNVMTTYDPHWCIDMSGTNVLGATGPVHTYAKYPAGTDKGLIIYNGLDIDCAENPNLQKIWLQELQQPFNPSNLPCGVTVLGITLEPATESNPVGGSHTVIATLKDQLGTPQPGIAITFSIISGPNAGAVGICSPGDCKTNQNGQVSFTYNDVGGRGIDKIKACFINKEGQVICSPIVTKEWKAESIPTQYYQDADGDGYGNPNKSIIAPVLPPGYIDNFGDCDDNNPNIHPAASEGCNGLDDDCDGVVDESCGCAEDDSGVLDVGDAKGRPGDEVEIPVRIQGGAPRAVYSFGFELTYDPEILEYQSYEVENETGKLLVDFFFVGVSTPSPGRIRVAGLDNKGIAKGASGTLVWLKFKVKGSAGNEGECYSLKLDGLEDDIRGFSTSGGCFCIKRIRPDCTGDLNGDGKITPADALIPLRCYLGTGPCPECADVDDNGQVSPADSCYLFRKYLEQPSQPLVNNPPIIISLPVTSGNEGNLYQYDVEAKDADSGDTLTYSLIKFPAGMAIDAATGLITWTPDSTQAGKYKVIVQVADGRGGMASQEFIIDVAEVVNNPPIIISLPVTSGKEGELYQYDVEAKDADSGDTLTYSLIKFPAGMVIDAATGLITWTPTKAQIGDNDVAVQVADGRGGTDQQSFNIKVEAIAPVQDYTRPAVEVTVVPEAAQVGETVTITIVATDNIGIISRELIVNGEPVPIDASGKATYSSAVAGVFTAVAKARDAAGWEGQDKKEFRFHSLGDTTSPVVAISSPADNSKLSTPTDIIGNAYDEANLVRYTLEYAAKGSNKFIIFATGTSPVVNAVLGKFDPTTMKNGLYDIRLTAEDASGNKASIIITYQIEGEMKVGNFTISFNDLTIPMPGMPITVTRTYDSRVKTKGDFGIGWMLDLKTVDLQENCVPGEGWEIYCKSMIRGVCVGWGVRPTMVHTIVVAIPGMRDQEFYVQANTTYANLSGVAQGNLIFVAQPGTFSTLEALDNVTYDWLTEDGTLTNGDFNIINPDRYKLTMPDGTVYIINQQSGLESIKDTNGNTITFGPGGIIHSAGKSVVFTRDRRGRINTITDPAGNSIKYEYDYYGDLVSVTDQVGNITRFTYNSDHGLVDIIDPRGLRPARNEYDASGRLIAHIDANGRRIEYTHNIDTRQEVVKDRLGNITVYEYDTNGNVVSKTDPLGNTTSYTYDARGNKLSETDALGNTTYYTYDSRDNILSKTDPLGNTTTYTYDAHNRLLTSTDPLGNTTTYTYDANGNLLTITDPLGNTTTINTYDAHGNLLSTKDALGNTTLYEYDAYGNMIKKTDPLGNVTTYTYDANGNQITQTVVRTTSAGRETITTINVYDSANRLIKTIDPYGNSTLTEYNPFGKQSATIDKNGQRTTYDYDARGNLIKTTYPDGTTETATYDARGKKITSTDRAGRTTTYVYNEVGNLIKTIYPDGSSTSIVYDAVGRLISQIDARGNVTTYSYDAAGHRIAVTDALGQATTYTYDKNGNRLTMTDANGHTTTYTYNKNNRCIKTTFPDGTFTTTTYDEVGRKVAETDQAGLTTRFAYDPMGRLVSVTDVLGQVTRYSYDELGNMITQTDANGHTTRWEYDQLGRVTKRILPLGMSEVMRYDAVGNLISKTDFNGNTTTYTYDSNNRLTKMIYPDGSSVSFTYTKTGQRASVTEARGKTTYSYDLRDRLVKCTNSDGTTISYTYDEAGNRTSVTVPSGTTTYTYDKLNRPETVTDPDGGITSYVYDLVGNRARITYPNGTKAVYTYNSLNRLIRLENRRSDDSIISSYAYTLGPAGNRIKVEEHTGRVVNYTYDSLYRLTEERIIDPVLGNRTITYTYDPVGNRLSKNDSGAGVTTYTYDENDRLLTENAITYNYDNNGNTISKRDGAEITSYSYDYENRLIEAKTSTTLVNYTYDCDGIRVGSTAGGATTYYLVDKNRDFVQVLEERDAAFALVASYVYGDDLISMKRGGATSYYHYDGQMSTRQLTDGGERITDEYIYDAFGILLKKIGTSINNYLYTGEQFDSNIGFYYLRSRYLNIQNSRFLTTDTFPTRLFDPSTLHRYVYVANDPINNIDPTGQFFFTLSGLMEYVSILEIFWETLPTFIRGGFMLTGIKLLMKPGFAFRDKALNMIMSDRLGPEGLEAAQRMYDVGMKMIEIGSLYIQLMDEMASICEMGLGIAHLAKAVLNAPRIIRTSIHILHYYQLAISLEKDGKDLLMMIARSNPQTVLNLEVRVNDWAKAISDVVDLLFTALEFIQGETA